MHFISRTRGRGWGRLKHYFAFPSVEPHIRIAHIETQIHSPSPFLHTALTSYPIPNRLRKLVSCWLMSYSPRDLLVQCTTSNLWFPYHRDPTEPSFLPSGWPPSQNLEQLHVFWNTELPSDLLKWPVSLKITLGEDRQPRKLVLLHKLCFLWEVWLMFPHSRPGDFIQLIIIQYLVLWILWGYYSTNLNTFSFPDACVYSDCWVQIRLDFGKQEEIQ